MEEKRIGRRTVALARTIEHQVRRWTPVAAERPFSIAAAALILFFWGATLTWAAMFLVAAILFQDSLRSLFTALNAFFSRTAELEISIGENRAFKFTAPVASEVLQKMADEIKAALARLSDDQTELFLYMNQNVEVRRDTLGHGPLQFRRVRPRTVLHWDLRDLRDIGLARPAESGSWREVAHPGITPFGELALKIYFVGRSYNTAHIERYLTERAQQPSERERGP